MNITSEHVQSLYFHYYWNTYRVCVGVLFLCLLVYFHTRVFVFIFLCVCVYLVITFILYDTILYLLHHLFPQYHHCDMLNCMYYTTMYSNRAVYVNSLRDILCVVSLLIKLPVKKGSTNIVKVVWQLFTYLPCIPPGIENFVWILQGHIKMPFYLFCNKKTQLIKVWLGGLENVYEIYGNYPN